MQQRLAEDVAAGVSRARRFEELDGLRGWAALAVALFHFYYECLGPRFPEFRTSFALAAWHGELAVVVFFVLSGFVLTHQGWRASDKRVVLRQIIKRYFRLMLPILAVSVIAFAIMIFSLNANREAGAVIGSGWLGSFLNFAPRVETLLSFSLWRVFIDTYHDVYQPFLWIMSIELWMSLLVLGLCYFERGHGRWLYLVLWGAIVASFMVFPVLAAVPLGALMALLHRDGRLATLPEGMASSVVAVVMLVALLLLAPSLVERLSVWGVPVAAAIVYLALQSGGINAFLRLPLSQFLGRISFPLYLVHFIVLVTLTSRLIVGAEAEGRLDLTTAIGIGLISSGASLLAAVAFYPVEWGTLRFGRWLGRLIR